MILAIDVGNTNIIIGVIDAKKTYFVERISHRKTESGICRGAESILEIYPL